MKKIVTILLAVVAAVTCCFGLAACGGNNSDTLRVGLIALHDSNSTYDKTSSTLLKRHVRHRE